MVRACGGDALRESLLLPGVKLDALLHPHRPREIPALAAQAEALGFDGLWFGETQHDALLASALAAEHTERVTVGTAITMAFTKSPMALAYTAWDVQSLAQGRFRLGLGSQVKGHLERRFSVPWTAPAPRMREVVLALRAIWNTWQTGAPLQFEGRHYRFSLMTPFFNPGPLAHPEMPLYLAGVNPGMARLAGELGQGLHVHPLHTAEYLREVLHPAVAAGAERAGRSLEDFEYVAPVFAATGRDAAEVAAAREVMRQQVAFYASTRTYRRVLDLHGWGAVGERLHKLSVAGRWGEMPAEVDDEMLEVFVPEAPWEALPDALRAKYTGLLDRVSLYLAYEPKESGWATFVEAFHTGANDQP